MTMVKKLVLNFNGITMAYAIGLVNALLQVLIAFGVPLSDTENASIVAFANAAMIVAAHLGHRLGEAFTSQHATVPAVPVVAPVDVPLAPVDPAPATVDAAPVPVATAAPVIGTDPSAATATQG